MEKLKFASMDEAIQHLANITGKRVKVAKQMIWVIESESGASYGTNIVGDGKTEEEAWEDAFGPKPWSPSQKQVAKKAWSREITMSEYDEIRRFESNR
jgi:hypothetical protein